MKSNICLVGLAPKYVNNLALTLSKKWDMFYADIDELINFDLTDVNRAQELCGPEYISKVEKNKIKTVSTYTNTIYTIKYYLLNDSNNLSTIKSNSLLVYVRLDKGSWERDIETENLKRSDKMIQGELFDDRDFILKNVSDIVVQCSNVSPNRVIELISEHILKFFKK